MFHASGNQHVAEIETAYPKAQTLWAGIPTVKRLQPQAV